MFAKPASEMNKGRGHNHAKMPLRKSPWCLKLHAKRHPSPGVTYEAAVQPVLTAEHHVIPANRADVRQGGWINSGLGGLPMPEHGINFRDLPVDNGGQDEPQTARPSYLLLPVAPVGLALLAKMLPRVALTELPGPRRFLVIDASGIQAPGGRGTQYRLHLCMDLVTLEFTYIAITDKRTGESLKHFPLAAGDVAVADRGYGHPEAIVQSIQRGADVLLRLNPHNVPVSQRDGVPLDLRAALRRQAPATVCTLPVRLGNLSSPERVEAWVHT
jgi:hypothetical protein